MIPYMLPAVLIWYLASCRASQQQASPTEEGAGIFVLANAAGNSAFDYQNMTGRSMSSWRDNRGARIDGFTVFNSGNGGGIVVNGYGDYLDICNNRISLNRGTFGGGIRVGHPQLVDATEPVTMQTAIMILYPSIITRSYLTVALTAPVAVSPCAPAQMTTRSPRTGCAVTSPKETVVV